MSCTPIARAIGRAYASGWCRAGAFSRRQGCGKAWAWWPVRTAAEDMEPSGTRCLDETQFAFTNKVSSRTHQDFFLFRDAPRRETEYSTRSARSQTASRRTGPARRRDYRDAYRVAKSGNSTREREITNRVAKQTASTQSLRDAPRRETALHRRRSGRDTTRRSPEQTARNGQKYRDAPRARKNYFGAERQNTNRVANRAARRRVPRRSASRKQELLDAERSRYNRVAKQTSSTQSGRDALRVVETKYFDAERRVQTASHKQTARRCKYRDAPRSRKTEYSTAVGTRRRYNASTEQDCSTQSTAPLRVRETQILRDAAGTSEDTNRVRQTDARRRERRDPNAFTSKQAHRMAKTTSSQPYGPFCAIHFLATRRGPPPVALATH